MEKEGENIQKLEQLTTQQVEELLQRIYTKGKTAKDVEAVDIVNEMKQVILAYYEPEKDT